MGPRRHRRSQRHTQRTRRHCFLVQTRLRRVLPTTIKIKVPSGTHPIQLRPYILNPVFSKQIDAILDSYLAAGLIQHSTSPWSSPLYVFQRNPVASEPRSTIKNYIRSQKYHRSRFPASMRSSIPWAAGQFFRYLALSRDFRS